MSENSKSDCGDWKAWHNRMAGGPATLHVTGVCTFPAPGYRVELRPAQHQGVNPMIYILETIVTPPAGQRPQVLSRVEVVYGEQTDVRYESVHIRPDGVSIQVQEVH